jgi:hypothetical protein
MTTTPTTSTINGPLSGAFLEIRPDHWLCWPTVRQFWLSPAPGRNTPGWVWWFVIAPHETEPALENPIPSSIHLSREAARQWLSTSLQLMRQAVMGGLRGADAGGVGDVRFSDKEREEMQ